MTTALVPTAAPPTVRDRFVEGLIRAAELGAAGHPMLEVALALVDAGWRVLPCHPHGKRPLIPTGFNGRSNDRQQVERWWGRVPEATVGIVPGDGGLVALDVDSPQAFEALREAGLLPSGFLDALKSLTADGDLGSQYGLIVATGGSSRPFAFEGVTVPPMHWYLRADGVASRIQDVVCRYDSGYVIAAGSRGQKLYRLLSRGTPISFARSHLPKPAIAELAPPDRAPDLERVRQAVACIPNSSETARDQYVAMAHMIKGAAGEEGRDIFLEWAATWPGKVNPAEDERVYDTITRPRLGWSSLWRFAERFGFDCTPEQQAEARNDFDVITDPPTATDRSAVMASPSPAPRVSVRSFATIQPKRTEWVLKGRLARGYVTMINGWPGEGKTTVVIDIVARLTRGHGLLDGTAPPRPLRVLFLSTEDNESTLRLRLQGAGADLDRVCTIPDTQLEHLTLPSNMGTWMRILEEQQIDVVVVDPMKPYLDDGLKDIAEQDARKFMLALRQICEARNVAAICIRHPNKATAAGHSTAISAASGSLGFTAAARIELLVGRMPHDEDTRALVHVKNNLAEAPPALLYRIVPKVVSWDEDCMEDVAGIEWQSVDHDVQADDLLARRPSREERSKLKEAEAFLKDLLASGPIQRAEVLQPARQHGIAMRTLQRAIQEIGWTKLAEGKSMWGLKDEAPAPNATDAESDRTGESPNV